MPHEVIYVAVVGFDSSSHCGALFLTLEAALAAHPFDRIRDEDKEPDLGIPRWKEDLDEYGRRCWYNGIIGESRVEITEAIIGEPLPWPIRS